MRETTIGGLPGNQTGRLLTIAITDSTKNPVHSPLTVTRYRSESILTGSPSQVNARGCTVVIVPFRNLTLLSTILSLLTITVCSGGYSADSAESATTPGVGGRSFIFESNPELAGTTMPSNPDNIIDAGVGNTNLKVANLPGAAPSEPDARLYGKAFKIAHQDPTDKNGCHADNRGVWHCH